MKNRKLATLANGCFWCSDAVFRNLKGVEGVTSGFMGGHIKNPAYREVVHELTGHAESIQFKYDPEVISYRAILLVFFTTHDPTSLNRQGYDVGTHYRSVIFYHDEEQKEIAENLIRELNEDVYEGKIVTEIVPADHFYPAEAVHQNFYNQNPEVPYCRVVINPKLEKLRNHFPELLKLETGEQVNDLS